MKKKIFFLIISFLFIFTLPVLAQTDSVNYDNSARQIENTSSFKARIIEVEREEEKTWAGRKGSTRPKHLSGLSYRQATHEGIDSQIQA